MARSIVSDIEFHEGSEPDDEFEGSPAEYTVTFYSFFSENAYEQLLDDYICFTREQLIELRDKITESLA